MSGGVTNVKIELCDFINVWSILSIKSNRERGGFIENVIVKQCRLINKDAFLETKENYKVAIYMDLNYKISEIESYSRGEIDCLDVQLKAQNIFNLNYSRLYRESG